MSKRLRFASPLLTESASILEIDETESIFSDFPSTPIPSDKPPITSTSSMKDTFVNQQYRQPHLDILDEKRFLRRDAFIYFPNLSHSASRQQQKQVDNNRNFRSLDFNKTRLPQLVQVNLFESTKLKTEIPSSRKNSLFPLLIRNRSFDAKSNEDNGVYFMQSYVLSSSLLFNK